MIASAALVILPTISGRGFESALLFQRTDFALALLMLGWAGIALAASGLSQIGVLVAAGSSVLAFFGMQAVSGNGFLGGSATAMLFAIPLLCLAFAIANWLFSATRRTKPSRASIPAHVAPPSEPVMPVETSAPIAKPEPAAKVALSPEPPTTTNAPVAAVQVAAPPKASKSKPALPKAATARPIQKTDPVSPPPEVAPTPEPISDEVLPPHPEHQKEEPAADSNVRTQVAEAAPEVAKTIETGKDAETDKPDDQAPNAPKTPIVLAKEAQPEAEAKTLSEPEPVSEPQPDPGERLTQLKDEATAAGVSQKTATLWRNIFREFPEFHEALSFEARMHAELGNEKEARACLEEALTVAPDDAPCLRLAARYASNSKDWPAAADYWKRAFENGEINSDTAAAYINTLIQNKRPDEAQAFYCQQGKRWPSAVRLVAAGALTAEALEQSTEAFDLWSKAMELDPKTVSHRRRAIRALLKLERYVDAARIVQASPSGAYSAGEMASLTDQVLTTIGRQDGRTASQVLDILAPMDPTAWSALIRRLLNGDDVEGAEMSFQRAIENGNDDVQVLRMGAAIADKANREDLQIERWTALADTAPDDAPANQKAALLAASRDAHDDVLMFTGRILAKSPDDETASKLLGNALIQKKDWPKALAAWKEYGAKFGLSPFVAMRCATALRGLGRESEAEAFIKAGLDAFPDSQALATLYARAAQARQDYSEAAERWKTAVTLEPTAEAPWSGLIFSLLRDGRHEDAEMALAEALRRVKSKADLLSLPHIRQLQKTMPAEGIS